MKIRNELNTVNSNAPAGALQFGGNQPESKPPQPKGVPVSPLGEKKIPKPSADKVTQKPAEKSKA